MNNNDIKFRTEPYPLTAKEKIQEVVSTFALENMPLTKQEIQKLRDVENGKTTTEELRCKLIAQYKQ